MEDESKKNNLRFDGVEDSQGENYEQTQEKIQRLIKDKLQLNISIRGAARVGLMPQVGAERLLQHLVRLLKNKPACEQHQSFEEQMFF